MKKRSKNVKFIFSIIIYAVGFVLYVAFLSKVHNISEEACICSFISSIGVGLFCCSGYLRQ